MEQGGPGSRPHRLDRTSALPLWAQLEADLRRRLQSGALQEDFPGELELVAEYGVSRNTAREAMRRLRAEGTVVAERGRRPRVNGQIRQPLGAPYSLYDSIEATGLEQHSVVRRLESCTDAEAAARLEGPPGLRLVHVERLRFAGGQPLAVESIFLPFGLAAPLLDADLSRHGLYDELAARTGIRLTSGSEHLRAVVPSASQRRELETPRGVAAFAVERLGRSGDRPVEWRHSVIRADRFSVIADFRGPATAGVGHDLLAAAAPLAQQA